jgi:hypothetical protein
MRSEPISIRSTFLNSGIYIHKIKNNKNVTSSEISLHIDTISRTQMRGISLQVAHILSYRENKPERLSLLSSRISDPSKLLVIVEESLVLTMFVMRFADSDEED